MKIRRWLKRGLLGLIAAAAVVYAIDDTVARLRHKPGADVRVTRYLAVPQKFNKVEYDPAAPVTEHCIRALLPHFGYQPCWYLERHTVRFVDLG